MRKSHLAGLVAGTLIMLACSNQSTEQQTVTDTSRNAQAPSSAEDAPELRLADAGGQRVSAQAENSLIQVDASAAYLVKKRMPPPSLPGALAGEENYQHLPENAVQLVAEQPLSTFSVDVDTGSYSNVRRMLNQGQLPPADAVRIEEFINYFSYQYPQPTKGQPFSVTTELADSPWQAGRKLLRVALQGYKADTPPNGRNLVFLLDVSGSMNNPDKLPLLKRALGLLVNQLNHKDRVAIVVYAGASGEVLAPTRGDQKSQIMQALQRLSAGGGTNGAAGIEQAYQLAAQSFIQGGVNRVILATDGDFNLGIHDHQQLMDLIKRKREQGIALTTLGFGQGNYNDHLMEQLADRGNGNYAYIDNINEARKVLVDELTASMQTIAKDVKIQIEFNPARVQAYRLIGYSNRQLKSEDFNNDKVDAGEIGAGHSVTALYEVVPVGSNNPYVDPLKYSASQQQHTKMDSQVEGAEWAQVKLRYKRPGQQQSQLITQVIKDNASNSVASVDLHFANAVATFAQLLKNSDYIGTADYGKVIALANQNKGQDPFGYRGEFIQLVRTAQALSGQTSIAVNRQD